MPKKTVNDENSEPQNNAGQARSFVALDPQSQAYTTALNNLSVSGIVLDIDRDGAIIWRTGHLEHIANLFAGDPATTERDYADDLAVARAYCREQWEALIAPQT